MASFVTFPRKRLHICRMTGVASKAPKAIPELLTVAEVIAVVRPVFEQLSHGAGTSVAPQVFNVHSDS